MCQFVSQSKLMVCEKFHLTATAFEKNHGSSLIFESALFPKQGLKSNIYNPGDIFLGAGLKTALLHFKGLNKGK